MGWYDRFASFYDLSVESVYRVYRRRIVEALHLEAGGTVLDLACGTGQNFGELVRSVGSAGYVVGLDASSGMLKRAARRVEREGLTNVRLLEADARSLDREMLDQVLPPGAELDGVVCTLGLSTIPDWSDVLQKTFGCLRPGGRYVIFDVFAERWVPQTFWVQTIARADLRRQSWTLLEGLAGEDFDMRFLEGSPHVHGGRPFLAWGVR